MNFLFNTTNLFVTALLFLIALFILSKAADKLTDSAISISKVLGISDIIIGATIVSLGTSLPEFATSISAIRNGSNGLALGNALGSIITNTTIILGIGALYGKIPVSKKSGLNVCLILVCLVSILLSSWNSFLKTGIAIIPRYLGYIFIIVLPIYLLAALKKDKPTNSTNNHQKKISLNTLLKLLVKILICATLVAASSTILVTTVQVIANRLHISEAVISATVVALGTSLPELSTVIVSAKKGYGGLAFGNLIGASLMNILLVLSTTIIFSNKIVIPNNFLLFHFPLAIIICIFLLICTHNTKQQVLTKKSGIFLITIYLAYLFYNILK